MSIYDRFKIKILRPISKLFRVRSIIEWFKAFMIILFQHLRRLRSVVMMKFYCIFVLRKKISSDITAVVLTVDPSHFLEGCLASIDKQWLAASKIELVKNISPFSKASQEALNRVKTPFYLSIDEDMMLYPTCFAKLYKIMMDNPMCAEALAQLYDPIRGEITGIRMYRTEVVRKIGFYPLKKYKGAEFSMCQQIKENGYTSINCGIIEGIHHPIYKPDEAFFKWRFMMEQARFDKKSIGTFHFQLNILIDYWKRTGDDAAIYAIAGYLDGIQSEDVSKELTYEGRKSDQTFNNLKSYLDNCKK
jgi:hypothetical protein